MKVKEVQGPDGPLVVFRLGKKETLNTYDAVRFVERPHPHLVPYRYRNDRGRCEVTFSIDAAEPALSSYSVQVYTCDRFCMLLEAFCAFFDAAERDGIFLKSVLFDPARIYVRSNGARVNLHFLYLPVSDVGGGLLGAFELLRSLPFALRIDGDYRSGRILQEYRSFFSVAETFSVVRFKRLVERLVHLAGCSDGDARTEALHASEPLAARVGKLSPARAVTRQKEQVDSLGSSACKLERERTGERWEVREGRTSIGSAVGADVQIADNAAISRRHATLMIREGVCFLRDEGSTNGTTVEGRAIPPHTWVRIEGCRSLAVADEKFLVEKASDRGIPDRTST